MVKRILVVLPEKQVLQAEIVDASVQAS